MKHILLTVFLFLVGFPFTQTTSHIIDSRDGKFYKTVVIGSQTWLAENLNADKFRNGDPILEAKTDEEWEKAGREERPAWCYYKNAEKNGLNYGKLYNWYAVIDPRGLAPEGWHIPTKDEWVEMTVYIGNQLSFGDFRDQSKPLYAGKDMKSLKGWKQNGNGTNKSLFCGLPGGLRVQTAEFDGLGSVGCWWTSTDAKNSKAFDYYLSCSDEYIVGFSCFKQGGISVRCIKD
jgi:uncharacterized protein (TIGR02145 family)